MRNLKRRGETFAPWELARRNWNWGRHPGATRPRLAIERRTAFLELPPPSFDDWVAAWKLTNALTNALGEGASS